MHKLKGSPRQILIAIPENRYDSDMNDLIRVRLRAEFKRQLAEFM